MKNVPLGSALSNRTKDGKLFKNIGDSDVFRISSWDAMRWAWQRKWSGAPAAPQRGYKQFGEQWLHARHLGDAIAAIKADPERSSKDQLSWIGHSTTLLSLHTGVNVLFDPIFSSRASPLSFAGPRRRYPPATTIDELPRIDIIAISHNHYDHLDKTSVCGLHARFPEARFVVPLRMNELITAWGVPSRVITALDWFEEVVLHGVAIGCTPAQHYGRHGLCDLNQVLWCGWCVGWRHAGAEADLVTPTSWREVKKFYYTGDTAYNQQMFEMIYEHFGGMDMAALPIGAYDPRWFMSSQHVDPAQAVEIFKILHVRTALAVHWGTFELANESLDEPPRLLSAALSDAGLPPSVFSAIPMGAGLEF